MEFLNVSCSLRGIASPLDPISEHMSIKRGDQRAPEDSLAGARACVEEGIQPYARFNRPIVIEQVPYHDLEHPGWVCRYSALAC